MPGLRKAVGLIQRQMHVLRFRAAHSAQDDAFFVGGEARSGAYVTGVEGAGDGDVGGALDEAAAIGEEG